MVNQLDGVSGVGLEASLVELAIREHKDGRVERLGRYWTYYRNACEVVAAAGAPYEVGAEPARVYAQERGLPKRLRGSAGLHTDDRAAARREVVIENDIAWRLHAMVDFMFGRPVRIGSTARGEALRNKIDRLLDAVWERSGGIALLQDLALLGHVYGYVDLLLRVDEAGLAAAGRVFSGAEPDEDEIVDLASLFRIEVVEPTRGVPILAPNDYRVLDGFVLHFERELNEVESGGGGLLRRSSKTAKRVRSERTEVITPVGRIVYEGGEAAERVATPWTGGVTPVAHIQNVSQPFRYEGLGEVEPLIPLQDELNTRLSDRANRVTMQSFKMYLARGIEGFDTMPVAPGTVWSTDNPDASIEPFGGDSSSPSEDAHIEKIREALDKQSGVPPLASGVVRAKIGNLSSANALRVTLMGVLSKTSRKRVTYGRGMARISEMVLGALDYAGVLAVERADRGVRLDWPDPLPSDPGEEAQAAAARVELGVPRERALAELGYDAGDAGVS